MTDVCTVYLSLELLLCKCQKWFNKNKLADYLYFLSFKQVLMFDVIFI